MTIRLFVQSRMHPYIYYCTILVHAAYNKYEEALQTDKGVGVRLEDQSLFIVQLRGHAVICIYFYGEQAIMFH